MSDPTERLMQELGRRPPVPDPSKRDAALELAMSVFDQSQPIETPPSLWRRWADRVVRPGGTAVVGGAVCAALALFLVLPTSQRVTELPTLLQNGQMEQHAAPLTSSEASDPHEARAMDRVATMQEPAPKILVTPSRPRQGLNYPVLAQFLPKPTGGVERLERARAPWDPSVTVLYYVGTSNTGLPGRLVLDVLWQPPERGTILLAVEEAPEIPLTETPSPDMLVALALTGAALLASDNLTDWSFGASLDLVRSANPKGAGAEFVIKRLADQEGQ